MQTASARNQLALFDLPAAAAGPQPEAKHLVTLPFQRADEIEQRRVQRIFHVGLNTVNRLIGKKLLRAYSLGVGSRTRWRIEYASVVAYCDRLRVENGISPRSVGTLNARGRRRDADLLPFPIEETCSVAEVADRIGCAPATVLPLIEAGRLIAYQVVIGHAGSPWRIHTPSVDRYLQSLHGQTARPQRPRSRPR